MGIVNISNERNPQLKDTTDREKLAFTPEYEQFVFILDTVISVIQNEREKDKTDNKKKSTLSDLITPLSSRTLVEKAEQLVEKGSSAEEVLKAVVKYDEENARQLEDLNERLVYYAQTASLGSIAIVIMHEILSGMTVIKRFLNKAKGYLEMFDQRTKSYLGDAENSHKRLLEVADSFTPLYNRDLRKKEYKCDLRLAITKSVRLVKAKKISADIYFDYSDIDEELLVGINEGELETILINLLDNACYWIKDSQNIDQRVLIKAEKQKNSDRISVSVSDSGSGILPEDAERIFLPGITSKPKGIGMGLVIVNELVSAYGGKTGVRIPGDINGATLVFDLPIKKR
ncbi:Adaptive-response sensory-kinase SasA [bioreactor metagenome]|uniref:Adaptive-response sensory-kinase SasA n=1 Tax=bioreactor metagenome TaxID=1076179 RepID=A0A645A4Y6_9ZZZZ